MVGTQVCLWGEFTPTSQHTEYMLYPRLLANAEVGWSNPEAKDWQRFQKSVESNFNRFERDGVNYSTSMYNVYASFAFDALSQHGLVQLTTEVEGYPIFYTTNGQTPSVKESRYEGVFYAKRGVVVKAGVFNEEGILLGKITEIKIK